MLKVKEEHKGRFVSVKEFKGVLESATQEEIKAMMEYSELKPFFSDAKESEKQETKKP